jgi:CRP-like cAMP-binding protein
MDLASGSPCHACRFKSKAIAVLSEEELVMLGKGCLEVNTGKGELFFREGAPSGHVVFLREGLAKIHKKGPKGKDQVLKIGCPGDYLGIQTILGDEVNHYSASAMDDSQACYIRVEVFRDLIRRNGEFAHELMVVICREELNYFNRFVSQSQKQLNGRLAEVLMYFSGEIFRSEKFNLQLTREEMASLVITTRESLIRALKEFSDSGIIRIDRRDFEILNPVMLKKISESG